MMKQIEAKPTRASSYQQWLAKPATQRLLQLEHTWINERIAQFYGYHLAYLGIDPQPPALNQKHIRYKHLLAAPWAQSVVQADAIIEEDAWPLAQRSLDVIVLQHSLEMTQQPHQLIREASRCLVPNGYLVIVGFNPYSWWGGWRWLRTLSTQLPWTLRPVSPWRIEDWLTLLDLKIEERFHCLHLWPLKLPSEHSSTRVDHVLAGLNWLPANAYILVARKTVAGVTPIRQRFSRLQAPIFGVPIAAATRVNSPALQSQEPHQ